MSPMESMNRPMKLTLASVLLTQTTFKTKKHLTAKAEHIILVKSKRDAHQKTLNFTLDKLNQECYIKMARNARHTLAQPRRIENGNQHGTNAKEACFIARRNTKHNY